MGIAYKQREKLFPSNDKRGGAGRFFSAWRSGPLEVQRKKCGGGRRVWGPAHPPSGMAIVGGLRYAFGRFLRWDWMHQNRLVNVKIAGVEVLICHGKGSLRVRLALHFFKIFLRNAYDGHSFSFLCGWPL